MPPVGPAGTFPARFWRPLEDGRVQCGLCPRSCRPAPGQRGFCFTRGNLDGRMVLFGHGRSSGVCVDPIEKKPLHHYLPGSRVLSLGTAGCNLACKFCQNWHLSHARSLDRLSRPAHPEALVAAALELGCGSVAFTYNDPAIFHEYAVEVAQACREAGLGTVAVTAGYQSPEPRVEFYAHMDAANIDLKAFSDDFYRRLCGARLQPVLETLQYVAREARTWLEVTTLVIPGENDAPADLDALARWLVEALGPEVPLHLTAFHPDGRLRDRPGTDLDRLREARERALAAGLHYVYVGNLACPEAAATYCHACGALLIGRDGYRLDRWGLTEAGACARCGAGLPGIFKTGGTPSGVGSWKPVGDPPWS